MSAQRRSGIRIMAALLKLLGKLKYIIFAAVFGGLLGNSCAIAVTTLGACCVAKLIDPSFTAASLPLLIGLTIGAGVLRGLLRFAEQYNNHFIAFKLLARLRDLIFGALRKLAPARLEGKQKGSLISMLTSDVETLEVFYAHTISPVLIALLVDGLAVVLISVIADVSLGLIALAAYLVIGIVIPFAAGALMKKDGVTYRRELADTSSYFLDSVKGIRDIVLLGRQRERGEQLNRNSAAMNGRTVSIKQKSAAVSAVSNLVVSLTILAATLTGLLLVEQGTLTPAPMLVALVLLFSSFGPVLSLAALPSNLTQTFASGDRILNFLEEKPLITEDPRAEAPEGFTGLKAEHVTFSYGSSPVLRDVSLEIRPGEIVGLVGPSGCGKSTLLKLMLRFYDPDSGIITLNGRPLRSWRALHHTAVMVSQDTYLFNDTIRANLLVARPGATDEELEAACRKASVAELIHQLPQGYDTEVGLLGDSLSTGERQRIGLARAFLSGAPLILLDEVTSNVDAINEGIILGSLRQAAADHTIVLVSHRESTTAICSTVYRVNEGRLEHV